MITRPSDAESEDHDTLADAAFVEAEARRRLRAFRGRRMACATASRLMSTGRSPMVTSRLPTVSRSIIPALRDRYANLAIVEITASPEILAERLAMRGRESRGEVLARLARSANVALSGPGVISIDNSGPREAAGERFADVLRKAMAVRTCRG